MLVHVQSSNRHFVVDRGPKPPIVPSGEMLAVSNSSGMEKSASGLPRSDVRYVYIAFSVAG